METSKISFLKTFLALKILEVDFYPIRTAIVLMEIVCIIEFDNFLYKFSSFKQNNLSKFGKEKKYLCLQK